MITDSSLTAQEANIPVAAVEQVFFDRYIELTPHSLILGQPTFQAYDSYSRKQVLLRCYRLPWETMELDEAIQFGQSKSPFSVRVKDVIQRSTETILVTNLLDSSVEEWAAGEAVCEKGVERLAHQIGDWMMDWKAANGREVAVQLETVRIGRTAVGRPYCRILGGKTGGSTAEAVSSMREVIGSVLLWNYQRDIYQTAPDTLCRFTENSSITETGVTPESWLGWLLMDHPLYRPPSIGDWLLGENPEYREEMVQRLSHHELAADSAWK